MGRADAAGREHVSVARAQRVERGDDLRLFVGDDAHFLQIDADIGEILGDVADVLVLGAPGQNLVADDQERRGDDAAGFGRALSPALSHRQISVLAASSSAGAMAAQARVLYPEKTQGQVATCASIPG